MGKDFQGRIEQVDANRWRIPKDSQPGMRVDGLIYASQALIEDAVSGGGPAQVANVATLPGIVKASLAMPDIHWGYGFCIGGVAAMDIDEGGVISPGGVGYDINCGVRLLRSDLTADEVRPRLKELVDQLFRDVPVGVGVAGPFKFAGKEMTRILTDGARYLVEKGLAEPADIEATESGGSLPGADPAAVSPQAIKRGTDQCGTLGAGNHFVEVQRVEEIYDAGAAEAMGLAEGGVTVMIHCGSRGLGHQVCQDAIKALRSAPGAPKGGNTLGRCGRRPTSPGPIANSWSISFARHCLASLDDRPRRWGCGRSMTSPTTSPRSKRTRSTAGRGVFACTARAPHGRSPRGIPICPRGIAGGASPS